MPTRKSDKIQVGCPRCGHRQSESRAAISTNCRKCGQYYRVEDQLKDSARPRAPLPAKPDQRTITCFDCGAELDVPTSAESTMCKRCSSYVDLKDYRIDSAVSKNFKTKGAFVVEPKGYVFNTEAVVEDAVIKGRFLGKLEAQGSVTFHTGADFRGSFKAAMLIVPADNRFYWPEPICVPSVDVSGELIANVTVSQVLHLHSTARMFGNVEAQNVVIEEGAVVVGHLRIAGS